MAKVVVLFLSAVGKTLMQGYTMKGCEWGNKGEGEEKGTIFIGEGCG